MPSNGPRKTGLGGLSWFFGMCHEDHLMGGSTRAFGTQWDQAAILDWQTQPALRCPSAVSIDLQHIGQAGTRRITANAKIMRHRSDRMPVQRLAGQPTQQCQNPSQLVGHRGDLADS